MTMVQVNGFIHPTKTQQFLETRATIQFQITMPMLQSQAVPAMIKFTAMLINPKFMVETETIPFQTMAAM